MSEVLVSCENVSKVFCRNLKKSLWYGVKDIASEFGTNKKTPASSADLNLRPAEFLANKDISFELKRGECLGLIGRNGAGKTTLLKMLTGLLKPDSGQIKIKGRVGSLVALGAGFNPILTGRENTLVNGGILGLSRKHIESKLDEIIDFSELEEFIDSPVQNYSSGMKVRLGFAVATLLIDPDVLILDEVLAVGDEAFRHKCYSQIGKLQENAAVIFVSHNMGYVGRICDKSIFCEKGRGYYYDNVQLAIEKYLDDGNIGEGSKVVYPPLTHAVMALDKHKVDYGGELIVNLELHSEKELPNLNISVSITNKSGLPVAAWRTDQTVGAFDLAAGLTRCSIPIGPLYFSSGEYFLSFSVHQMESVKHLAWFWNNDSFEVQKDSLPMLDVPIVLPDNGFEIQVENS